MTIAYVEMIGGASGNMLLGALIDAGADAGDVERALRTIPVSKPWTMRTLRVTKRGIAATYLSIEAPGEDGAPDHSHDHRHPEGAKLSDVIATVEASGLTDSQKSRARAIYTRLAESEARVHGSSVEAIHFHEVGATDAILDVAGTCFALDVLGVARLHCSAFPIGHGSISMEHGQYPNPPPATADLLRGFTTFDGGQHGEMVTTTGAAILTTLAGSGTARPAMTAERIGYGAGTSDFEIPNVLRVSIGPSAEGAAVGDGQPDVVAVLQANIDDMSPQFFELAIERTFAAGALDVWLAPISMKKSRPAVLFCAIAPLERERECADAILRETTTLGVRIRRETRHTAERRIERISTPLGTIRVKTATVAGVARRSAEYDDLLRIAREQGRPIAEVALEVEKILG